jgi:hypothetical protein
MPKKRLWQNSYSPEKCAADNASIASRVIERGANTRPRPIGTTFAGPLGKLMVARIECSKCGWFGPLHRLIDRHGGNRTVIDWLEKLTADCARRRAASVSDQCHARCLDLPKVL